MGGSITHPEPKERRAALGVFLVELEGALREAAASNLDPSTLFTQADAQSGGCAVV